MRVKGAWDAMVRVYLGILKRFMGTVREKLNFKNFKLNYYSGVGYLKFILKYKFTDLLLGIFL